MTGRSVWAWGLAPFGLSLLLYLFLLAKLPREVVEPTTRWEEPAVAISLARTGTFADPYALPTGPTAHLPPLTPAINGMIYALVGVTMAGGYMVWIVTGVIWAILCGLMPWVAERVGLGRRAGLLAGVAGALFPRGPGHGEHLAALGLALIVAVFAARRTSERRKPLRSFGLGLLCGGACHAQPAILTVVAGLLAFELWRHRARQAWGSAGMILLGFVVACAPWTWRNYRTFDAVFFVRSNFGLELRMGHHPGAVASMEVMDRTQEHRHPRTQEAEARRLQEVGEVRYMREARAEAMDWIRAHPGAAAKLTAERVALWWCGPLYDARGAALVIVIGLLAAAGLVRNWTALGVSGRAVLVIPLVMFPLVYYLVAYMPRYRQPVDWIFLLLASAAITGPGRVRAERSEERSKGRSRGQAEVKATSRQSCCAPGGC